MILETSSSGHIYNPLHKVCISHEKNYFKKPLARALVEPKASLGLSITKGKEVERIHDRS
jgi:hypothetical protein